MTRARKLEPSSHLRIATNGIEVAQREHPHQSGIGDVLEHPLADHLGPGIGTERNHFGILVELGRAPGTVDCG